MDTSELQGKLNALITYARNSEQELLRIPAGLDNVNLPVDQNIIDRFRIFSGDGGSRYQSGGPDNFKVLTEFLDSYAKQDKTLEEGKPRKVWTTIEIEQFDKYLSDLRNEIDGYANGYIRDMKGEYGDYDA